MGNSDALQALSILTNALSKAHSVNIASEERRLDREYQSDKLDESREYRSKELAESREYELKKLNELRAYNESLTEKQNEYDIKKLLLNEAFSQSLDWSGKLEGVNTRYMESVGTAPNIITEDAKKVITASYQGPYNNIKNISDFYVNKVNATRSAVRATEKELSELVNSAAQFYNAETVKHMNLNIADDILDEFEFGAIEDKFILGNRLKGIDDKASSAIMKKLYYATDSSERVRLAKEAADQEANELKAAASDPLFVLSKGFDEGEELVKALKKGRVKDSDIKNIRQIFALGSASSTYEALLGNPMGGYDSAMDYMTSLMENKTIPLAYANRFMEFVKKMDRANALENPALGLLEQLNEDIKYMKDKDPKEAITRLEGLTANLDAEAQADYQSILANMLNTEWGTTEAEYFKALEELMNPDPVKLQEDIKEIESNSKKESIKVLDEMMSNNFGLNTSDDIDTSIPKMKELVNSNSNKAKKILKRIIDEGIHEVYVSPDRSDYSYKYVKDWKRFDMKTEEIKRMDNLISLAKTSELNKVDREDKKRLDFIFNKISESIPEANISMKLGRRVDWSEKEIDEWQNMSLEEKKAYGNFTSWLNDKYKDYLG